MNGKTFFTAYTIANYTIGEPEPRFVIIYAKDIGQAHRTAREHFGKGISFSVRESTHDETLHAEPRDILRMTVP